MRPRGRPAGPPQGTCGVAAGPTLASAAGSFIHLLQLCTAGRVMRLFPFDVGLEMHAPNRRGNRVS